MLKFEGIAQNGDRIRAYDFEPFPGRPERFVEGKVLSINEWCDMAKGMLVLVEKDTMWDGLGSEYAAASRVNEIVFIPYGTSMDYDGRVTVQSSATFLED